MPNLKEWIEAQLKRGYSRIHMKFKNFFPPAVAEVGKFTEKKLCRKIITQRRSSYTINLILVLIAGLVALDIYLSVNKNKIDIIEQAKQEGHIIKTTSGTIIGIEDNSFILQRSGINFTIVPTTPLRNIEFKKILSDGSIVNADVDDFKVGSQVTISGYIENDQSTVLRIVIKSEN